MSLPIALREIIKAQIETATEDLISDPKLTEADAKILNAVGIARAFRGFRNVSVGVATPCAPGRSMTQETYECSARGLVFDHGLTPASIQSFEVANNRQALLDGFIRSGYRRLLFLDADTVVDWAGVEQMLTTMDRWKAAMVSALVFQRYVGADGQFNAFFATGRDDVKYSAVTRNDIPQSLTAFPIEYCGLACAVLDLEQISKFEGPHFKRVAEGNKHYGEDIAFGDWLKKNGLDYVVDPKVATVHCVQHRFQYAPPKTEP